MTSTRLPSSSTKLKTSTKNNPNPLRNPITYCLPSAKLSSKPIKIQYNQSIKIHKMLSVYSIRYSSRPKAPPKIIRTLISSAIRVLPLSKKQKLLRLASSPAINSGKQGPYIQVSPDTKPLNQPLISLASIFGRNLLQPTLVLRI